MRGVYGCSCCRELYVGDKEWMVIGGWELELGYRCRHDTADKELDNAGEGSWRMAPPGHGNHHCPCLLDAWLVETSTS